jgi:hypothetical protein
MRQLWLRVTVQFRDDPAGQNLAQLDTPLIKASDRPDRAPGGYPSSGVPGSPTHQVCAVPLVSRVRVSERSDRGASLPPHTPPLTPTST